jgi:hypothetical protein
LPWYPTMTLSTDWTGKVLHTVRRMKPDILHVTSPSLFIFPAILASRLFGIPLIASYHTHLPVYLRSYVRPRFLCRLFECIGTFSHVCVCVSCLHICNLGVSKEENKSIINIVLNNYICSWRVLLFFFKCGH